MKHSKFFAALCGVVVLFFAAQPIFAQKVFLDQFKTVYPGLDNKFANCSICHAIDMAKREKPSKKNLNPYGKDLQSASEVKDVMGKEGRKGKYTDEELAAVAAAIKAIGSKDSNGNGKSNDDDIKAGVAPGSK